MHSWDVCGVACSGALILDFSKEFLRVLMPNMNGVFGKELKEQQSLVAWLELVGLYGYDFLYVRIPLLKRQFYVLLSH